MAGTTALLGGAALLQGGTAIAGGMAQSGATREAARIQRDIARRQIEEVQRQFDAQREMLAPFLGRQGQAGDALASLLGIGGGGESAFGALPGQNYFADALAGRNDLAGGNIQDDPLFQRVQQTNQNLFSGIEQDPNVQFAEQTQIVGDQFEESPGYRFAVEEGTRAGERALSRGGGLFGGRAAQELQRRTQGLAQQEFYNYAAQRSRDLQRQDIARQGAQRRQELGIARGDAAYENFLGRQLGDRSRRDAMFGGLLGQLAGLGGAGNPVGQLAGAAGGLGGGIANILGRQGATMGGLAQQQGANFANALGGVNAAFQGLGQNLLLQNLLRQQGGG